ncbi:MAG: ATP synthase F1 subunit delta [Chthonomonadetes bacterium]|nr:ATP synthase F1 subunit delta [Chthonomonadetes bacterium]
MRQERVARRYARALFNAALHEQAIQAVDEALQQLLNTLQEQPSLHRLLVNPLIPRERKQQLVQEAIGRHTHPLVASLLGVLVDKRREPILPEVVREFEELRDEHLGIIRVQATTARPLDEEQQQALIRSLEQRTGKTVLLSLQTDPSLIGGIVVRIGDTIIDGSVRGQLLRLKQYLLNA